MATAAQMLADAMQLAEAEREGLAGRLLDSLEPPPGPSIDDREEFARRAAEARSGVPGIPWSKVKRGLTR